MKVVILHQHFNTPATGGGIRSWYLAKALLEKGIEVSVITTGNEKKYFNSNVDGIDVHYLPISYDNKFGFRERSMSFLKFAAHSARLAGKIGGVNLCYAISVPLTVGMAAIWVKKRHNIPFIFEVGDLWPEAPIQLGFVNNFFFKHFLFGLEKRIYLQAEAIVALSPSIKTAIESKIAGKKIYLIPNMADCDFFKPDIKDPELEIKFDVTNKFVISYTGAVGLANGLDYLLECAHAAGKNGLPIQFILCGDGALRERLKALAFKLMLSNVLFVDFQDRNGIREVMNITDATFVCYKRVPVLETGSPNKFFDGLAAGKLIIINFGGWIRKEIEDNLCGFYADPNEPLEFVRQIKVFQENAGLLKQFQAASRALAEEKYSRHILSERFVRIVQGFLK